MECYLNRCRELSRTWEPSFCAGSDAISSLLVDEILALTVEDKMEEYMFLGLRLKKGISVSGFEDLFRVRPDAVYGNEIKKLKEDGLLIQNDDRLFLSKRGTDVANYVMSRFILEK